MLTRHELTRLERSLRGTQALRERAVDRLDLSERLLDDDAPLAERIVREAFDQDAQVSCVDGPAAARLDAEAQGLAAQLRFVPSRPGIFHA